MVRRGSGGVHGGAGARTTGAAAPSSRSATLRPKQDLGRNADRDWLVRAPSEGAAPLAWNEWQEPARTGAHGLLCHPRPAGEPPRVVAPVRPNGTPRTELLQGRLHSSEPPESGPP